MNTEAIPPGSQANEPPRNQAAASKASRTWIWKLALVVSIGCALFALKSTHGAAAGPTEPIEPTAVAVAKVTRQDLFNTVTIPAEFRPYFEVELHAKVSGYLDQLNVDIGDRVKAGELLAVLDAPDLVAQLNSAIAAEAKAAAASTNTHAILSRLRSVRQENTNLISQQEIDTADANDRTAIAALAAARADKERFQTMVNYLRITAPFDGVVTRRNVDPGALIQAGTTSATQSLPLVRLSDNYKLRLDFDVSVALVQQVHVGDEVEVHVESLAGKTFTGTISRRSEKVDDRTRTMTAEVDVSNPQLELVPGMYATVVLKLDRQPHTLTVPTQAVTMGEKPSVYVVNDNSQIEERQVTLGLETPEKFEIKSGLKEGELVIVGNHALTRVGQKVAARNQEQQVGP